MPTAIQFVDTLTGDPGNGSGRADRAQHFVAHIFELLLLNLTDSPVILNLHLSSPKPHEEPPSDVSMLLPLEGWESHPMEQRINCAFEFATLKLIPSFLPGATHIYCVSSLRASTRDQTI